VGVALHAQLAPHWHEDAVAGACGALAVWHPQVQAAPGQLTQLQEEGVACCMACSSG